MDLGTLFEEMSGYDDFYDYNFRKMPMLGSGTKAQVYRMLDEDDFLGCAISRIGTDYSSGSSSVSSRCCGIPRWLDGGTRPYDLE